MNIQEYYTEIDLTLLPSKGLFYSDTTKIWVRGATAFEVERFESGDFTNYYSAHQEIFTFLCNCVIIEENSRKASINSIADIDKFWLLLKIKTLTDGQNILSVMSNNPHVSIELSIENLEYWNPTDFIIPYYNNDLKCFYIDSPQGKYYFKIPTIGINACYFEWIRNKVMSKKDFDKEFITIAPFFSKSNNYLSIDAIDELKTAYDELNVDEFKFIKFTIDNIYSSFGIRHLVKIIDGVKYTAQIDLLKNTNRIFNKIN